MLYLVLHEADFPNAYSVRCKRCQVHGPPAVTEGDAAYAWNAMTDKE